MNDPFQNEPELPTQPEPPPFSPLPEEPKPPSLLTVVNGAALAVASNVAAVCSRAVAITIVWGLHIAPALGVALPFAAALGLVLVSSVVLTPIYMDIRRDIPKSSQTLDVVQTQSGQPMVRMGMPSAPAPVWVDHLTEIVIINPSIMFLAWLLSLALGG